MNNQENILAEDIILIDKPAGLSSFGAVARVRRRLSEQAGKKVKVGHTGTLDPFATGLLILLSNKATKMSNQFLKLDKWYEATICLGKTSTTGDPEGEIIEQHHKRIPTFEEIETAVTSFIGQITQTVPAFSAVKINGRRAYQLARHGESVVMPTSQAVLILERLVRISVRLLALVLILLHFVVLRLVAIKSLMLSR